MKEGKNINVVLNGTDTNKKAFNKKDIFVQYGIPKTNTIMLCIGNITTNKNQIQIVRAYHQIKQELRKTLTILFLGNEVDGGEVRNEIKKLQYEDNLILCGFVDRENMPDYFLKCSLNLFPSLNDGFGLPIIEGFVHGVPALACSDIDAIEDLYSEQAMILVEERNDKAFAETIEQAMLKNWDNVKIKTYGNKFSLERMVQEYHKIFEEKIGK